MQNDITNPPFQVGVPGIFRAQSQCRLSTHTTSEDAPNQGTEEPQPWTNPSMVNDCVDQHQYLIPTKPAPASGVDASWANTALPHADSFEPNQSHETQPIPKPSHLICQQQFWSESGWASEFQYISQIDQFDVFQALGKLATRQGPKGNLFAVDVSDSFVVVDLWQHDMPIIYVSDNFRVLTGYVREEVIGRNARFLQSPDGMVQAGVARDHISSASAWELKQQIAQGREFQYVVKNFRKNREPFLNLLTIIPLPEDTQEIRYWFGVQMEFSPSPNPDCSGFHFDVEAARAPGDSVGNPNDYPLMDYNTQASGQPNLPFDWNHCDRGDRNISFETTAKLLAQITGDDSNTDSGFLDSTDWNTMLLENVDGLVHVISSKGVFVYVSPSWAQLGYSQSDLFGTSIKDICHPADILTLIDHIEKAKAGNGIDEVFRIRHRDGHYARVHHYGSAWDYDDAQWVSFVGRQEGTAENVCEVLENSEFLGDEDVWFKITASGLILAVFSSLRNALGISADNVVGTTFQNLIKESQSRKLFENMLNHTKDGHGISKRFKLQEAESQSTSVETTIFAGDTSPSGKPCFLLVRCRTPAEPSLKNANYGISSPITPRWPQTLQRTTNDTSNRSDNHVNNNNNGDGSGHDLKSLLASNRALATELRSLRKLARQRKRARITGTTFTGCVSCGRTQSPEWRRGADGERNLCNRCGLRYARAVKGTSLAHSRRRSEHSDTMPDGE